MIERERALAGDDGDATPDTLAGARRRRIARAIGIFLIGMASGIVLLFVAAYIAALNLPGR
jgi:hypothetical protein